MIKGIFLIITGISTGIFLGQLIVALSANEFGIDIGFVAIIVVLCWGFLGTIEVIEDLKKK